MHTVDLLNAALTQLRKLDYAVRHEPLDGLAGGVCRIRGRWCLLLDLAQSPQEQLQVVLQALRGDHRIAQLELAPELRGLLRPEARPFAA